MSALHCTVLRVRLIDGSSKELKLQHCEKYGTLPAPVALLPSQGRFNLKLYLVRKLPVANVIAALVEAIYVLPVPVNLNLNDFTFPS